MSDVSIRIENVTGHITLTRPKALNALSRAMSEEIDAAIIAWADDPSVEMVLIDAEGERAFCAGGDIREIYEAGKQGDFSVGRDFWRQEYLMNSRIAHYPKPWVAIMHGYVMGGGVGLSGHGSHRVVTDSSRISMPECNIGLIPDVGGTHLLARARGRLGEFLGLTGFRMGPSEAIFSGFADHYVPEDRLDALKAKLIETADPEVITEFQATPPEPDFGMPLDAIDDAFSAHDIATLIARLEVSDVGHTTVKTIRAQSPLSMACTLELVRRARREPGLNAALIRELRCTWHCISEGDLLEGIRAAVVDRDRKPVWLDKPTGVHRDRVTAMLEPLGADDLDLPVDPAPQPA